MMQNQRALRFLILAIAAITMLRAVETVAAGDDSRIQIESVDIGFAGTYKVGHWAPVWVTISGVAEPADLRVELVTVDGDGVQITYRDDRELWWYSSAQGQRRLLQYIKTGRTTAPLTVRILSGDRVLAERGFAARELPTPRLSTQQLILVLGPSIGENEAVRRRLRDQADQVSIAQVEQATELPRRWQGYAAVNIAIVATSQVSVLEAMDGEQFQAFQQWLALGGRLVFCVGQRGDEVLGPGSRFAAMAPGTLIEVSPQRTTSGLEDFASATERLDTAGGQRIRRFAVPMTVLSDVRGVVESSEIGGPTGQLPTIVRHAYGLGQVTFLAFDPDLPPFDRWQGRPSLVARVLQSGYARRGQMDEELESRQLTHLGYDDLIGQFRAALDQFVGVVRVDFSWVVSLIVIYVLLIGPVDYYMLKRFQRWHWTWLTFPLAVLGFALLAVLLSRMTSGDRIHINHMDLVDVDVQRSLIQGTSWLHLYSPSSQTFNSQLDVHPGLPQRTKGSNDQLFTWQGLPGDGLGGLNTRATEALFTQGYALRQFSDDQGRHRSEMTGMPIQISSSKALMARWSMETELPDTGALAVDPNGLLSGRLINPLEVELSDCQVLYRNWSYPLTGTIGPGATVAFEGLRPRNLEWRLTRRQVVETREIGTPWDQSSWDVPRILEILMFYQAAGGRRYTGLTHRYQPHLDLSEHLRTGQAILVGRSAQPATSLLRDGQSQAELTDRHWTFYRIVYPVE
ncbi:MAG: hypothetical protein EA424_03450 [Planctomycetaceae bacterium]|nr:MAG: hypothetical protein EA424_03450 [Planctomycetaceae bacterium]